MHYKSVIVKISEALWSSIVDIYDAIVKHPFIRGLTSGELDVEKFKYYIIQDYLYLGEYVRALAVLSAKAPSIEALTTFTRHILGAVEVEQALHRYYMGLWGLDPSKYVMSPTNRAYTSFLLMEAYSKPFYEALAAVLPCYWIYQRVGLELAKYGSPRPEYRKWIETYSSVEYSRSVEEALNIVDSLNVTDEQLRGMVRAFRLASIYEYLFWDSAYRLEQWPFSPEPKP